MSADFAAHVTKWLDEHCQAAETCVGCRRNAGWLIHETPVLMATPPGSAAEAVPFAVAVCKYCAAVRLYSTKMMGWEPPAAPGS
jgi:hypothetical protein